MHITDVITRLKDYRTRWWEHMGKIEDQKIPKILLKYNPADPERPQKRWVDQFII
jgi:hypothetical protein